MFIPFGVSVHVVTDGDDSTWPLKFAAMSIPDHISKRLRVVHRRAVVRQGH